MKKWASAGLGLLALGCVVVTLLYDRSVPAPVLSLPLRSVLLGSGEPNSRVEGSITIENKGNAPLEYSTSASCSCTKLAPGRGTVAAGGRVELAVALSMGPTFEDRRATIQISTNDPRDPIGSVDIAATCPAPAKGDRNRVTFGRIAPGVVASEEVILRVDAGVDLTPTGLPTILATGSEFDCHVERAEGERTFKLKVGNAKLTTPGTYASNLAVCDRNGKLIFSAPVSLEIGRDIIGVPSRLAIDRASVPDRKYTLLFKRVDGKALASVARVVAPQGFRIVEAGGSGNRPGYWAFTVEIRDAPTLPDHASIEFFFEGEASPIVIEAAFKG